MKTIQLQISDELAIQLAPYREQWVTLLETGLQLWQQTASPQPDEGEAEQVRRVLVASGRVRVPKPYPGAKPYVRRMPVPITGQPVSEIVIEQRGPR
jgi:hypothetical protein